MKSPIDNLEANAEREPNDPRLDALLNEALGAKHVPMPKGMNDRILAAMAQAHRHTPEETEADHAVLATVGIARWVWIGVAAAAAFAVSAVLLMQGSGVPAPSNGVAVGTPTVNSPDTVGDVAWGLEKDLKSFSELGNTEKDPLDRDLAALSSRIEQSHMMWESDPGRQETANEF